MQQINIHEAKTHLSALVEKAAAGEGFIIAKAGKPMVRVVPYVEQETPMVGFMKGQMRIPDDFDTMGEKEIAEIFGI